MSEWHQQWRAIRFKARRRRLRGVPFTQCERAKADLAALFGKLVLGIELALYLRSWARKEVAPLTPGRLF